MHTSRHWLALVSALGVFACASSGSAPTLPTVGPNLGRVATDREITAWDISIPPSGEGLPAGSGSARQGEQVYVAQCLVCHGAKGVGKPADPLVGGRGSLATAKPLRTVGSYWPYATTLFDYIRRSMPATKPFSLDNADLYAVTAYLLYLNDIVSQDAVIDARSLPQIRMPNRDGFVNMWRK